MRKFFKEQIGSTKSVWRSVAGWVRVDRSQLVSVLSLVPVKSKRKPSKPLSRHKIENTRFYRALLCKDEDA